MIAGVDVNLRRVTICYLGSPQAEPRFQVFEAAKGLSALDCARWFKTRVLFTKGTTAIWIERPMGRHIKSVADLMRVFGAIVPTSAEAAGVSEITPPEWKKQNGLPGNCGKPVVIEWATKRWPDITWDEHMADAYAVACACWHTSLTYQGDTHG